MRLALSYPITPVTASDSKLAVTSHASTGLGKQAEPSTKRARPQSLPRKYSPRAGYRQTTVCDKSRPVFRQAFSRRDGGSTRAVFGL